MLFRSINNDLASIDHVLEDLIHIHLEGCQGDTQVKEYDSWFEEFLISFEHSDVFISRLYLYVIISPLYIDFRKQVHSMKFVEKFRYKWEWVHILDRD